MKARSEALWHRVLNGSLLMTMCMIKDFRAKKTTNPFEQLSRAFSPKPSAVAAFSLKSSKKIKKTISLTYLLTYLLYIYYIKYFLALLRTRNTARHLISSVKSPGRAALGSSPTLQAGGSSSVEALLQRRDKDLMPSPEQPTNRSHHI